MSEKPKRSTTLRDVLFQVHLWVGLIFCIPFVVLGLTGSYLVYDQDFVTPPMAQTEGVFASPEAIFAAAERPGFRSASLTMPEALGEPAIVRLANIEASQSGAQRGGPPGRGFTQVYIDPVSLAPLGDAAGRNAVSDFMHRLHGNLFIGGREGRSVVGWLGVGMTLLGLTGLVLWWPRRRALRNAFLVRKGARGYPLHRQLHGAAGIWGWVVFVVVSFSGVAISFPNSIGPFMHSAFGGAPLPPINQEIAPIAGRAPIGANEAVDIALAAMPGARLAGVFLPNDPEGALRVTLERAGAIDGTPTVSVSIDPYRGEVVAMRDPQGGGFGNAFMAWQRPLHDGQGLGPVWKFLVFVSGLLPPLFVVTGISMWWIKRRNVAAIRVRKRGVLEGAPAE